MNLLSKGGTIVVVGLKPNQIPLDYAEDSRFNFWSALGNNNSLAKKELPSNCKGLVMTRFLNHALFRSLTDQAKRKNITIFPVSNTGEVRRQLDMIAGKNIGLPGVSPDTAIALARDEVFKKIDETHQLIDSVKAKVKTEQDKLEAKPKRAPRNFGIRDFVLENTDFSESPSIDMPRLCLLLKEKRGLDYTPKLMQSMYYDAKRIKKGPKFTKRKEVQVKAKSERDEGELSKLLDSAILSLQLMKGEIDKLDSLQKENEELKSESKILKERLSVISSALRG